MRAGISISASILLLAAALMTSQCLYGQPVPNWSVISRYKDVLPTKQLRNSVLAQLCNRVVLNEIMVNARYDFRDEYIELYNSNTTFAVDIGRWLLQDREAEDSIVDFTGSYDLGRRGTVIPPLGYALIMDRQYRGYYNDNIRRHADLDKLIMVTTADNAIGNGLNNERDSITVIPYYGTDKTVSWSAVDDMIGHSGISWEYCPEDEIAPWDFSWATGGCTPGYSNVCY